MYLLFTSNKKVEKKLGEYMVQRQDIANKLERLRENPRSSCGAHPLKGPLKGKWAAWLGSNIRLVYTIDDINKIILAEAVGPHKVY